MRKCKCWSSQTCTAVITTLQLTHICPYKHKETRAGRHKIFSTVFLSSTRSFRITGQSEELNMTTFNLKTGLNCWSVEPAVFTLESLSDPLTDIFFCSFYPLLSRGFLSAWDSKQVFYRLEICGTGRHMREFIHAHARSRRHLMSLITRAPGLTLR